MCFFSAQSHTLFQHQPTTVQFWHYTELAQTPRVRAQSHKTAPVSDTSHKWGSPDYPHFCLADYKYACFCDLSSPSLIIHWNESQKSWKLLCLWLQFYYKRYNSGTAKWKRCIAQDMGVGVAQNCHTLSVWAMLAALWCAHQYSVLIQEYLFQLHCTGIID